MLNVLCVDLRRTPPKGWGVVVTGWKTHGKHEARLERQIEQTPWQTSVIPFFMSEPPFCRTFDRHVFMALGTDSAVYNALQFTSASSHHSCHWYSYDYPNHARPLFHIKQLNSGQGWSIHRMVPVCNLACHHFLLDWCYIFAVPPVRRSVYYNKFFKLCSQILSAPRSHLCKPTISISSQSMKDWLRYSCSIVRQKFWIQKRQLQSHMQSTIIYTEFKYLTLPKV